MHVTELSSVIKSFIKFSVSIKQMLFGYDFTLNM